MRSHCFDWLMGCNELIIDLESKTADGAISPGSERKLIELNALLFD